MTIGKDRLSLRLWICLVMVIPLSRRCSALVLSGLGGVVDQVVRPGIEFQNAATALRQMVAAHRPRPATGAQTAAFCPISRMTRFITARAFALNLPAAVSSAASDHLYGRVYPYGSVLAVALFTAGSAANLSVR